jgi:L-threonylcarbamoyladenylate synthase
LGEAFFFDDGWVMQESLLEQAAALLHQGGVVAFPTETVYGLGADALNPRAVARIFEIKQRPFFDPLIVHVAHEQMLDTVVAALPPSARRLAQAFWPGPLTLILPKKPAIPDLVTSGLPGVGVRMPAHDMALKLIRHVNRPLAAPSANPFGAISPTTAAHVRDGLGAAVDMVLDGGACEVGVESTIVSFMQSQPMLLRPGGLALEAIESHIGPVLIPADDDFQVASPGRLLRHYAPGSQLFLCDELKTLAPDSGVGVLAYSGSVRSGFGGYEVLSPAGDVYEAAANLFAALRRLDALGVGTIYAQRAPHSGLGRAINDRLWRASVKSGAEGG